MIARHQDGAARIFPFLIEGAPGHTQPPCGRLPGQARRRRVELGPPAGRPGHPHSLAHPPTPTPTPTPRPLTHGHSPHLGAGGCYVRTSLSGRCARPRAVRHTRTPGARSVCPRRGRRRTPSSFVRSFPCVLPAAAALFWASPRAGGGGNVPCRRAADAIAGRSVWPSTSPSPRRPNGILSLRSARNPAGLGLKRGLAGPGGAGLAVLPAPMHCLKFPWDACV